VPTSVLLAVLAAAGLLALAPALTRRYDATERVAAERATSTARVLSRRRRRRMTTCVAGAWPVVWVSRRTASVARSSATASGFAASSAPSSSAPSSSAPSVRSSSASGARSSASGSHGSAASRRSSASRPSAGRRPAPTALHRRRRVFLGLVLLNLVELAGVFLVGPGFWIGFSVSFTVLLADLVYLRRRALAAARLRATRARRAAWIAREQAAVRREHERRAAERIAALRRLAAERESVAWEAARRRRPFDDGPLPYSAPGS
jgi:hypothetical protein